MRRLKAPLFGNRLCGNIQSNEVHDLDSEDNGTQGCQIDKIINSGLAATFYPDTLDEAHRQGYNNCMKCIGNN